MAFIDIYVRYFNGICLGWIILVALFFFVKQGVKTKFNLNEQHSFEFILKALSAQGIPTGILIIICAFYPKYLNKLADFQMYLGIAGLMVLFSSVISLMSKRP